MTVIVFDLKSRRISTLAGRPVPGGGVTTGAILTSLLYPLEVIESLQAGATFVGTLSMGVESLDVSATLYAGTLDVTIAYKEFDAEPEAIDVEATLYEGVLTVVISYEAIDAEPQELDVTATLHEGVLLVVINYIHYDAPVESLDVGATLHSGVLTSV